MKIPEMIYGRMNIRQRQILLEEFSFILLGAILLLLLAALGERSFLFRLLRIALGLIYILFIPGYCITTAIFPRVHEISHVERLGLSIGLSIACVSVLALILDRLPWGLSFWPILLGEYTVITLFATVTIRRRSEFPSEAAYIIESTWQLRSWWNSQSGFDQRLYKMLAGGLLIASGLATLAFLLPASSKFVTEFYVVGKDNFIENYPYKVGLTDPVMVSVGVVNHEQEKINYHIEVWITDSLNPENRVRVAQSQVFLLQPGEKNEQQVSWRMPQVGNDQKVELLLFYNDDIAPYRRLQMWINVEK